VPIDACRSTRPPPRTVVGLLWLAREPHHPSAPGCRACSRHPLHRRRHRGGAGSRWVRAGTGTWPALLTHPHRPRRQPAPCSAVLPPPAGPAPAAAGKCASCASCEGLVRRAGGCGWEWPHVRAALRGDSSRAAIDAGRKVVTTRRLPGGRRLLRSCIVTHRRISSVNSADAWIDQGRSSRGTVQPQLAARVQEHMAALTHALCCDLGRCPRSCGLGGGCRPCTIRRRRPARAVPRGSEQRRGRHHQQHQQHQQQHASQTQTAQQQRQQQLGQRRPGVNVGQLGGGAGAADRGRHDL